MKKIYVLCISLVLSINVFSQEAFNIGENHQRIYKLMFDSVECDVSIGITDNQVRKVIITPSEEILSRSSADKFVSIMTKRYNLVQDHDSLRQVYEQKHKAAGRPYNVNERRGERIGDVSYILSRHSIDWEEKEYRAELRIVYELDNREKIIYSEDRDLLHKSRVIKHVGINNELCNIYILGVENDCVTRLEIHPSVKKTNKEDFEKFLEAMRVKYDMPNFSRFSGKIDKYYGVSRHKDNLLYMLEGMINNDKGLYKVYFKIIDIETINRDGAFTTGLYAPSSR